LRRALFGSLPSYRTGDWVAYRAKNFTVLILACTDEGSEVKK